MGACFQTATLSGSKEKVKVEFAQIQKQDLYENGHSYSGGFGMAQGLKFEYKEFDNGFEACEWLQENCQKWEHAKAVKIRNTETWLIGAWCSE